MYPFRGNLSLNHREEHDDDEEQDRGRGSPRRSLGNIVVDVVRDRVHVVTAGGSSLPVEQGDDRRVLFKRTDQRSDHDVNDLRGKKRNGNAEEGFASGSAVDLRGLIVLLIDSLQTGKEDQNLIRQCVPDNVNAQSEHTVETAGAHVDPTDISQMENRVP